MIGTSRLFALGLALAPLTAAAQEPSPRPVLNLSLEEAVQRAMTNNVDIAVERFSPEQSELSVGEFTGSYEPLLTSTVQQNSRASAAQNAFAGAQSVNTDTFTYNLGAQQNLRTGGNLRVDFNNNRQSTNSVFQSFNPSFASNLNASLGQPLLRNFKIDGTRYQIKVAKKNREISDVQFRQTVVNTVASVKNLYYDLLYTIDNLEAQRKSLSLASKLVDENRIKVRVGTLAPLDVVAAESEQAGREEAVILAEAAVADAEDALKRAIFPSNDGSTWATRIVPTDRPTAEPVQVDAGAAIQKALSARTDLVATRKRLESSQYAIDYARNQLLPGVDLVAAYGAGGIGGTLIEREGLGGPILRSTPGGYSNALGDVFGRDFPTWTVGVNFSYPIFNRQADAAAARARVSKDQSEANLRRLEMQVTAEVRSAARAVETNYKRVESTRAARGLQVRRLDAETKKFAAGMSTNFLVTQSQRDLAVAEVAELRAIADYRKSLVNFDRVQEAGFSGTGGSGTISVSSTPAGGSSSGSPSGGQGGF